MSASINWQHWTDTKWQRARMDYLTATDIVDLLPSLKNGFDKTKPIPQAVLTKIAEKKFKVITDAEVENQAYSQSAKARGHILEPYAISEANPKLLTKLYHWDDKLIYKFFSSIESLSFSPDAMSIQQSLFNIKRPDINCSDIEYIAAEQRTKLTIAEIKSYSAGHHLQCILETNDKAKERYQLAVGMAILESIEVGHLIYYNPSVGSGFGLHIKSYNRSDLEKEIEQVKNVVYGFTKAYESIYLSKNITGIYATAITEENIAKQSGCYVYSLNMKE